MTSYVESGLQSLATKVMTFIEEQDLPLAIRTPTEADGNCYFHAISDLVQEPTIRNDLPDYIVSAGGNHLRLRMAVMNFLEKIDKEGRHELFNAAKDAIIQDLRMKLPSMNESQLWSGYMDSMRKAGTWADDIIVMCTSWFIGRSMEIVSQGQPGYTINPKYCHDRGVNPGPKLTLGYLSNIHFQALIPLREMLHNTTCRGCNKEFKSLNTHLAFRSNCKIHYNPGELEKLTIAIRKHYKKRKNKEDSNRYSM